MNNFRVGSTYFLIFILGAALFAALLPTSLRMYRSYNESAVKSSIQRIQAEILFMNIRNGQFQNTCTEAETIDLTNELRAKAKSVACNINPPAYNKILICGEYSKGHYYCADAAGVTCQTKIVYREALSCKDV
ncbi:hypothetical protein CL684_00815 [Candidatus Campbellbacteria bacterium]|nr:hypothetical protein [Candidatus Campbellbacteria bacterium]|tara:strand:- start:608 stop:1006 length:399 start_codon:yes stop_codon:yes gene_type:complete